MAHATFGLGLWLTIFCQVVHHARAAEYFSEELHVRPLQDGRLYTHFSFSTLLEEAVPRLPHAPDEPQHYTVFPLALGQVIRQYAVTELHLALNAGKWNYDAWGIPDDAGVGSGAELWAWMGDEGDGSFEGRWRGMRNALAGLFCASLGELDERRTTTPAYAFTPDGDLPANIPHRLMHSSHPSEGICTENLTPFLKLLPCKARSGIAALLNPHRLFDADWHGMSVHVLWHAAKGVQVRLGVQAVFDPMRLRGQGKRDWEFSTLFERTIESACPVADATSVRLDLPIDAAYRLSPEPTRIMNGTAVFDIHSVKKPLDVGLSYPQEATFTFPRDPAALTPLSIVRSQTGTSQANGRLHVSFKNGLDSAQRIAYLETPPWIVKFHLHTLELTVDQHEVPATPHRGGVLQELTYVPPLEAGPGQRQRPTHFEPTLLLPPRSTVRMSLGFEKTFLRYTEHPPDAQRGWDLPPAVIVPLSRFGVAPANESSDLVMASRMYTNTLLVDMATPDFSMPYNVIIMSCTLIAMLFGSVFNLLTRRFVAVKVD